MYVIDCLQGSHSGAVTNNGASQQENPGFETSCWLPPLCIESACSHCACMGPLKASDMHCRSLGDSKLDVCVNPSENGCLSLSCVSPVMDC